MTNPSIPSKPRLVTRFRLLPLAVLCSLTLVAGTVGLVHGGVISSEQPAAAATVPGHQPGDKAAERAERQAQKAAEKAAEKARKACVPGWKTGVKSEPWVGSKKRASEAAYKARIKKENAGYIKGAGGNYLFSDLYANNFSQSVGRITQTAKKQKQWAKYFEKARKLTEAQGGVFHIVVAPATWEVNPRTLPTWAQSLRGTNTLNKLMKAYPKLPWIDVRKPLLTAEKKKNVYIPVNSHWTNYGGYVAWKAITRCLGGDSSLDKVGVPSLASIKTDPNYNEFAGYGIKDGKKAWTVPVYSSPLPGSTQEKYPSGDPVEFDPYGGIDAVYLPAVVQTPDAQSDETLLVYRDSTGSALSPLWRYSYQTSYQYHHGVLSDQKPTALTTAIGAAHPDVFLYVISERNLDGMPPKK